MRRAAGLIRKPLPPDTIRFNKSPLKNTDRWTIQADAHPTAAVYDQFDGLGTMRYAIELTKKDASKTFHTAYLDDYKFEQDGKRAYRVIVRRDNSYTGYLTGFFNVPGVFGSYPHQVTNHIGVDCADLIVGAWNEFRPSTVAFTNVTGLRYQFPTKGLMTIVRKDLFLTTEGKLNQKYNSLSDTVSEPIELTIATASIHIGDVILFNYAYNVKDRSWDHVGVLFEDKSRSGEPNGKLDESDLILHAGPAEARIDPLGSPKFTGYDKPVRISIVRWKP